MKCDTPEKLDRIRKMYKRFKSADPRPRIRESVIEEISRFAGRVNSETNEWEWVGYLIPEHVSIEVNQAGDLWYNIDNDRGPITVDMATNIAIAMSISDSMERVYSA